MAGPEIFPTLGLREVRRIALKNAKLAGPPHLDPRLQAFLRLLSALEGHELRTVARWVGGTEAVVLSTCSHLLPDEKDQIAEFIEIEFKEKAICPLG